ncbi:MAG: hypothetical protein ACRDZX_04535 [Acidimicrobiales bacterium]
MDCTVAQKLASLSDTPGVPKMPRTPLTVLLSWAWIAYVIEVDNAVESAGAEHVGRLFNISVPRWANGLRLIPEEGITLGRLQRKAEAHCNIGGLERWGWIAVGEQNGTHRTGYGTQKGLKADTVVRPTRAGSYARRLFPQAVEAVEQRWRHRLGTTLIDELRAGLAGPAMPWSPPEVHPSDGFLSHVVDADDEVVEDGPLVALLGQTLTAFTVEQEDGAAISLPLAANFLRVLDAQPLAVKDLPACTGLSKEAVAMALGFLQRRHLTTTDPGRTVRLNSKGQDLFQTYRKRAWQSEDAGLRAVLSRLLEQTEALSAGLTPPEGGWRARPPYLAQTHRLLANPTGALPWHPMVLHRGGWPDGS